MTKLSSIIGLAVWALFLVLAHADVAAGVTEDAALVSLQANKENLLQDQQQQEEEKDLVPSDADVDAANNLTGLSVLDGNNLTDEESEDGGAELGLSCRDDPNHQIPVPGAVGGFHSCNWLSHQNDFTIQRWCDRRGRNGRRTKNACRVTCNNCPSLNPTCSDSSTFCVPFASIGGGGGCHTCAWISRQNRSTRESWCNERDHRNRLTRDHCRATCDNCPSSNPRPTPPSSNPTCRDSRTFRFPSEVHTYDARSCQWLSTLNRRRRNEICQRRHNGRRINRECRLTCNNCPSSNPRPPPPTPSPTRSPRPTCRDSSTFCVPFIGAGGGGCHTCAWISRQNRSTRETWCNERDHRNRLTRNHCRATCNNCPSNNTPVCRDSTNFEFPMLLPDHSSGTFARCDWLATQSRTRINEVCGAWYNGRWIKSVCRKTCDNCPRSDADLDVVSE